VVTPAETAPAEAPPTELAPAEVEPGLVPLSGIEALEHTEPGRVILVLQDGSVEDVPADPEVAERARYLADNLIRRDPPAS
jgi:hypothetical protein